MEAHQSGAWWASPQHVTPTSKHHRTFSPHASAAARWASPSARVLGSRGDPQPSPAPAPRSQSLNRTRSPGPSRSHAYAPMRSPRQPHGRGGYEPQHPPIPPSAGVNRTPLEMPPEAPTPPQLNEARRRTTSPIHSASRPVPRPLGKAPNGLVSSLPMPQEMPGGVDVRTATFETLSSNPQPPGEPVVDRVPQAGGEIDLLDTSTEDGGPRPQRFFQCESCGDLTLEMNSPVEVHQGPSSQEGIGSNYFVHLLSIHNKNMDRVRVRSISSQYLNKGGEWVSTSRTSLATYDLDEDGTPSFDVHNGFTEFEVQGNTTANLAVSCVVEFEGTPAEDPLERTMAHASLPQPLNLRIVATEQGGKQTRLITEQVNPVVTKMARPRYVGRSEESASDLTGTGTEEDGSMGDPASAGAQRAAMLMEARYRDTVREREDIHGDMEEQQKRFQKWYQKQSQNEAIEKERLAQSLLAHQRGNVDLFVRVRPLLTHECVDPMVDFSEDPNFLPVFPATDQIVIRTDRRSGRHGRNLHFFQCDKVFTPLATQHDVYEDVRSKVQSVMDGYNVCLMVYGQTGSGKTYTMSGPDDGSGCGGVVYSALRDICEVKAEREADPQGTHGSMQYEITLAVMEIYNEKLFDLLRDPHVIRDYPLDIRRAPNGDTYIKDLTEATGSSLDELLPLLYQGMQNRSVGVSNVNLHSSRSHCVVKVHVCGRSMITGSEVHGTLFMVDLAGSERLGGRGMDRIGTSTQFYQSLAVKKVHMQRETGHINRSLAALGDVIEALVAKKSFIPFRNSKLTYLLQNSMDGGAKMMMIINVAPTEEAMQETLSSLAFAGRVARVQLPEHHPSTLQDDYE